MVINDSSRELDQRTALTVFMCASRVATDLRSSGNSDIASELDLLAVDLHDHVMGRPFLRAFWEPVTAQRVGGVLSRAHKERPGDAALADLTMTLGLECGP